MDGTSDKIMVRRFRQILFWPLQLMPLAEPRAQHWRALEDHPDWTRLEDDFPNEVERYRERHYREFVAFLPHVQRFLYGERGGAASYGESPLRIYRRKNIAAVRVRAPGEAESRTFRVKHADVYFFFDADVMIPVVEIWADDIDLDVALDVMNRFGRAYPSGWDERGDPANCFDSVEWLDAAGKPLAQSDLGDIGRFYSAVIREQVVEIGAHWDFLLRPMRLKRAGVKEAVLYRPLEFHRMPLMAFVAVDDPRRLTRAEFVRLAFSAAPGPRNVLPLSAPFLETFEKAHCYDRYYDPEHSDPDWPNMRMMCTPQAFVMVGPADDSAFVDAERGYLGQFRHQFFMLGLIAHFHRAAVLMMSNRLVEVIRKLDPGDARTVGRFRRDIRRLSAGFLRFNHRYYFTEVSDQAVLRDIFRLWSAQLGTAALFAELRAEVNDGESFMEADLLRRQAVTILQLTVVTMLSLIGTVTTGFLGMNIFAYADMGAWDRFLIFLAVFVPTTLLTMYTVMKSRRLANFLDKLGSERSNWKGRLKALAGVWSGRSEDFE
ncbi:hypothetical protein SAMN06265338_101756 [Rhodoblastus acidophilus]|uniref:CorA-like Mg2+ transporter protein n=1 Tax=Rhodoblastus acidophilus TaxID=1074 RepID=A0A212QLC9_RHOAC|nr:hypothetical protein [Rhodoblastus acidophilus]MCW2317668.1 hypothetical protein [Rhodoblastus acidophilus]PPQ39845.1 hypothetical protein CKO16_03305 [Rhodoblastus acidophilus]RAI23821.1 hypothetical protein CH337_02915 [Rhodoblastus acidophilus]SNB60213.1 hypothetical protein SAMN06265338_101756 [Rhodoblastus acidophilus]